MGTIDSDTENRLANELLTKIRDEVAKGRDTEMYKALRSPGAKMALTKLEAIHHIDGDLRMLAINSFRLGAYVALSIRDCYELFGDEEGGSNEKD